MNNPSATTHELASAYATQLVKRLGLTDEMSVARGDAEMVWDLAYDAFMWRTQPSLPLVGGGKPGTGGLTQVEDDAADDDGDGTIFKGGRL